MVAAEGEAMKSAWQRFWALPWKWKGPALGVALFLLIGFLPGSDETEDATAEGSPTGSGVAQAASNEGSVAATPTVEVVATTPATPTVAVESAAPTVAATPDCPSLEQRAWFTEIAPVYGGLASASSGLSERSLELGSQPTLLFDSDWNLGMAAALFEMQQVGEGLIAVEPVDGTEAIAEEMNEIGGLTVRIVERMVFGLDNVDLAAIDEATRLTNEARGRNDRLLGLLNGFCD